MAFAASAFPEPIRLTCAEISSAGVGNTLEFIKGDYNYIVRLPVGSSINRDYIDKISPLLTLWELPGAELGVYTWLLFDLGDAISKQIVVKKNINVTEIATKHTDILKDICLNKQHTDMMVVNCRESHIALRKEEAQCIHIAPVKD